MSHQVSLKTASAILILLAITLASAPVFAQDCQECKGGVIELTLRYTGDVAADIVIVSGSDTYDIGTVAPGGEFTLNGTADDGKFDNNDLDIFIDGVEQAASIHVSCSQPIGPGAVFGDLEVVEALSKDNPLPVCALPDCQECKGGVIELTLRYNGAAAAGIVIVSGSDTYALGTVAPGDEFTLNGTADDGKFDNNDLDVFIDGVEQAQSIHVSCSQPIGPGAVFGDLEVVEALSKDNPRPVCALPPPPDCQECKGGVIELTLRYNGAADAAIVIVAGDVTYDLGTVAPGQEFTLAGTESDGKFANNNLDVFIDGVEQAQSIHVSCSQPIGPGAVFGDLEVVEALSKDNPQPVCAVPPPPDCQECKGGVIELTLRYNGDDAADIVIVSGSDTYDLGTVAPGGEFTIAGTESDGKFDNNDLDVFINGVEQPDSIHVSCSQPIGPGAVFGDLEVVEALSKDNPQPICPLPDCMECEGGVTELVLLYNGEFAADIVIKAGDVTYDIGLVDPGATFTLNGTKDDGKFENNDLDIFIDGVEQATAIHVSCSRPIGPGALFGDLEVVSAQSKDNPRPICPLADCLECKGGVLELTLRYNGDASANIVIEADKVIYDLGTVAPGEEFTLNGTKDDGKFEDNDLLVFFDGVQQPGKIHVSCSRPIGPGSLFGALEVVEAISKDNPRPVCPRPCEECDGGVTRLTLRYDGAVPDAEIVVFDDDDEYFRGIVQPGTSFTFWGTKSDGKFQKNELEVWVNGFFDTTIHVSCSQDIGPGLTFGSFFVVDAYSRDGGWVCPFCVGDQGAPVVSYEVIDCSDSPTPPECGVAAGYVTKITIADDLGLQDVVLALQAFEIDGAAPDLLGPEIFPGDPRFPVVESNTFAPGALMAMITVRFDPTVNTIFYVSATDICDQNECAADPEAPRFLNVVVGDSDGDGIRDAAGQITDATGIVSLDFFFLDNSVVDFLDFVPGATVVNFRVERDNPNQGGFFGAIAADECNAFAFDY